MLPLPSLASVQCYPDCCVQYVPVSYYGGTCEHTHVCNLLSTEVSFPAATSKGGTGWARRKDGEAPAQADRQRLWTKGMYAVSRYASSYLGHPGEPGELEEGR